MVSTAHSWKKHTQSYMVITLHSQVDQLPRVSRTSLGTVLLYHDFLFFFLPYLNDSGVSETLYPNVRAGCLGWGV